MIAIAVLALPLAWVAKEQRQSAHELQLAEQLDKLYGVAVELGGPFDLWDPRKRLEPQPWWRDLARKVLGERVRGISIESHAHRDLNVLSSFSSLQALNCGGMDMDYTMGDNQFPRDLTPLAKHKTLRWLALNRCQIRDLSPLDGLSGLTTLKLRETNVPQEQIDALQKALPNCEIDHFLFSNARQGRR